MKNLRVALVHDWLTGMRGGEKCLEVLCELFPDAPIFTLLHIKNSTSPLIESKKIYTSFINYLPFVEKKYRNYLPLFPKAIEQFNFNNFDLVISTSHCVAKSIIVPKDCLHICYCHTPMRYVWDLYDEYFGIGRANFFTRFVMKLLRPYLQNWDVKTASRVNYFIANSINVKNKIKLYYNREAVVINPPVDTDLFTLSKQMGKYFLIVSALVPYKRVDIAIKCFNKTGEKLIIVGKGPNENELKKIAKSNIEFVGWASDKELAKFYKNAKALIFPGEEDFGIVPLEAMACGKPVIAFAKGGALETVIDKKTGIFFKNQIASDLEIAINKFKKIKFSPIVIRNNALKFSRNYYAKKMNLFLSKKIKF